jgi:hypothetical protein
MQTAYDLTDRIKAALTTELNDAQHVTDGIINISTPIRIDALYRTGDAVGVHELKRKLQTSTDHAIYLRIDNADFNSEFHAESRGMIQTGDAWLLSHALDDKLAVQVIHEIIAPWNQGPTDGIDEPSVRPFSIGAMTFHKFYPFTPVPKSAQEVEPGSNIYRCVLGMNYIVEINDS